MPDNKLLIEEAQDMMRVCNACRYCEGFCGVWRAMEYRREFPEGDLDYLANLCHDCSECYYACQYAPPHEWAINPPLMFARIRGRSYEKFVWPKAMASAFQANGLVVGLLSVLMIVVFFFGVVQLQGAERLTAVFPEGDFFQVIPHKAMIVIFGVVFLFSILAMGIGLFRFVRDIGENVTELFRPSVLKTTIREVLRLEYLDGAGWGCTYPDEESSQLRRWLHHFTFYGFLLCFAATALGFIYHYAFGWHAPYDYISLPVICGTLGGIGLLIGPGGLLLLKQKRNRDITDDKQCGVDTVFLLLLIFTSATGLLLLAFRETGALGTLLIIHLAFVMTLFLTFPYSKFVHAIYRLIAIAKYALERERKKTIGV